MVVVGTVVELDSSVVVVVGAVVVAVLVVVVLVVVVVELCVWLLVVVDGVVVVLELVAGPSSLAPTTASATPRPMTAATRTTSVAFTAVLIPWRGGSPGPDPSPGGGTSMRRVGSSCTGGSVDATADTSDRAQCSDA